MAASAAVRADRGRRRGRLRPGDGHRDGGQVRADAGGGRGGRGSRGDSRRPASRSVSEPSGPAPLVRRPAAALGRLGPPRVASGPSCCVPVPAAGRPRSRAAAVVGGGTRCRRPLRTVTTSRRPARHRPTSPADRAPEKDRAPAERRPSEPAKDSPGSAPSAPAEQPPAPAGLRPVLAARGDDAARPGSHAVGRRSDTAPTPPPSTTPPSHRRRRPAGRHDTGDGARAIARASPARPTATATTDSPPGVEPGGRHGTARLRPHRGWAGGAQSFTPPSSARGCAPLSTV